MAKYTQTYLITDSVHVHFPSLPSTHSHISDGASEHLIQLRVLTIYQCVHSDMKFIYTHIFYLSHTHLRIAFIFCNQMEDKNILCNFINIKN